MFYSLLHIISHKRVEMRREALVFTVFFLTVAAVWLILAAYLCLAASSEPRLFPLAVRYAPQMARSALLSVPLAVAGGLIIDLTLRGK